MKITLLYTHTYIHILKTELEAYPSFWVILLLCAQESLRCWELNLGSAAKGQLHTNTCLNPCTSYLKPQFKTLKGDNWFHKTSSTYPESLKPILLSDPSPHECENSIALPSGGITKVIQKNSWNLVWCLGGRSQTTEILIVKSF